MDLAKVQEIALSNQKSLTAFDEWAEGIERRVVELEQSKNVLVEVQIALKELTLSNKYFGEKLQDMKQALDKINDENKAQHNILSERIKKIEEAPGDKWNKASWAITIAIIGAAIGFLIEKVIP